ncbi:MBL fold metallo-hydrolase [Candidatus Falkowbacteria bacterium]|nr:MBL fold metallo-hydrolase [Candidatus Falkowbacteria bacterium]
MRIKFCGAAKSVTGSSHLLTINDKKILLDCGMVQGGDRKIARERNEKFLFSPAEVDAVILSHAHIDHSGNLPTLVKAGFRGKIYSTIGTKDLVKVLLEDSAYIQEQDADFILRHFGQRAVPLFQVDDVKAVMRLFQTFEYGEKFAPIENVSATFFDAGHVLGSAIVSLDIKEKTSKTSLVFTGDLGRKNMPILNDPYQIVAADTLITESTYASHIHDSFSNVHEELTWIINDVVKRGGKILIPGFSLERTQELVYVLHELYEDGKIPQIPIFVDSPLSSKISAVFNKHQKYYDKETCIKFLNKKKSPFYFRGLNYTEDKEASKKINEVKEPCIIIAASGMCEAGRILHHLRHNIENPKTLILVVGFMAAGTLGRDIVEGRPRVKIFKEWFRNRAEVVVMNAFSAHADKLELLEYIKKIKGLKKIFAVHGEATECAVLRDNIYSINKFGGKIIVPEYGNEFEI